jgi:heavy metal translocating P-type ATPase
MIINAATLEKLYKVDTVVVDKTGTITKGKPELVSIKNFSDEKAKKTDSELISILASLEKKSEHPIAHSIISYAKEHNINLAEVDNFEAIKGKGLKGIINNTEYYAGNAKLVKDIGLFLDEKSIEKETVEGNTPIILTSKENILGIFLVADSIKPEAKDAITHLHQLGIKIVMLTGDNKNTAKHISEQVGIGEVVAEVLPDEKQNKIKELQAQGKIVAMAGDGVNDAPALAQADVGVAMATGTDVAIESAGITLLHGDISKLVKAVHLSKLTMRGIKQNLFWAFFYNIVGIPLAGGLFYPIFGWLLNPIFAGLAMAFSSVSVVGNSLRLKTKKI